MRPQDTLILGFMVTWKVDGTERERLYQALEAEGGWGEGSIGENAGMGRMLDNEFGVSVKWGRTKITGLILDAMIGTGKEMMMPSQQFKEATEFAVKHRNASPAAKPLILAFCSNAAMNEGGFEKVGEFQGGDEMPTFRQDFLETIKAHK